MDTDLFLLLPKDAVIMYSLGDLPSFINLSTLLGSGKSLRCRLRPGTVSALSVEYFLEPSFLMSIMMLELFTLEDCKEDAWGEIFEGGLKAFKGWVRGVQKNPTEYLLYARKEVGAMDNEKIA